MVPSGVIRSRPKLLRSRKKKKKKTKQKKKKKTHPYWGTNRFKCTGSDGQTCANRFFVIKPVERVNQYIYIYIHVCVCLKLGVPFWMVLKGSHFKPPGGVPSLRTGTYMSNLQTSPSKATHTFPKEYLPIVWMNTIHTAQLVGG